MKKGGRRNRKESALPRGRKVQAWRPEQFTRRRPGKCWRGLNSKNNDQQAKVIIWRKTGSLRSEQKWC
jgi:hypothetical protein